MSGKIIGPWKKWTGEGYAPCPICGGEVIGSCRCFRADSECENGHSFHICTQHQVYVHGKSDHSLDISACTCGKDDGQMSLLDDDNKEPVATGKPYYTKPVYAVYTTTNEWGNIGKLVCYTTDKKTADFEADKAGWWNGKGRIFEKTALVIGDEIFVLDRPEPITFAEMDATNQDATAELKVRALKKLTSEEQEALGLGQKR